MIIKLYEKYVEKLNVAQIKDKIIQFAAKSHEIEMIEFLSKRGYDIINDNDALYQATYVPETLKYFLDSGAEIEKFESDFSLKERLKDIKVQKVFIDFGEDSFVQRTVGFNSGLKYDPKYADYVKRAEEMDKYNI